MIRDDARGRRVAIVADCLVNPGSALYAGRSGRRAPVFDVLIEDGWGIMKPPPHVVDAAISKPAVALIAGDAVDYRHHGYDVVVVAVDDLPGGGVWLDLFDDAFRGLAKPMPPVLRFDVENDGRAATPSEIRASLAAVTTA